MANNGLYAYLLPDLDEATLRFLSAVQDRLFNLADKIYGLEKLHVTLCYDTGYTEERMTQVTGLLPLFYPDVHRTGNPYGIPVYSAKSPTEVTGVGHHVGHDGKLYFFLQFKPDSYLDHSHTFVTRKLECTHSYTQFKPHMTLAVVNDPASVEDADAVAKVLTTLAPKAIRFGRRIHIEPIGVMTCQ